jgi:hypothetical protein
MLLVRLPMLTKLASITSPGREKPADAASTKKPAGAKKLSGIEASGLVGATVDDDATPPCARQKC